MPITDVHIKTAIKRNKVGSPSNLYTEDRCIMTFKFINRWSNPATFKIPTIKHVNCIISRTEAKATKIRMKIQKTNKLFW